MQMSPTSQRSPKEQPDVATENEDQTQDIPEIEATDEEENGAPLDRVQVLPLVALRDTVIFPEMIVPLQVGRDRSVKALDRAVRASQPVALVTQRSSEQDEISNVEELYTIGTLAKIAQVIRLQDGTIRAIVQGQRRIRLLDLVQTDPHLEARVEVIDDQDDKTLEIEALMASIHGQIEQYVNSGASVPPEVAVAARNIVDGGLLADMTAYSPEMTTEQRQELLETIDVADRLRLASAFLAKQIEVLELKGRIQSEVKSEMDKTQREYILREQMKAIQKELGEDDPAVAEATELREKVEQSAMPDEVKEKALKEVDRLSRIPSASPEQGVIRTYVDWLVSLPWGVETDDNLDLDEAEKVLHEDHWGLEKPKERIVEYMAVRKLAEKIRSPILLFVGPPGVGKTSLGKSIARAMGRKFVRMSLGGIHDEAEIRGHRRTYIGALPGRVIQNIKTAGSANPVFMLDEIDKVGMDFRGDPVVGAARGARSGAEQQLPGQLPGGAVRPVEGAVHRHGEHARHDPAGPSRPDGGHPAPRLHAAGASADRRALPRAEAAGGARPDRREPRLRGGRARAPDPGVHPRGGRPEPRARDRERVAQGRTTRCKGLEDEGRGQA